MYIRICTYTKIDISLYLFVYANIILMYMQRAGSGPVRMAKRPQCSCATPQALRLSRYTAGTPVPGATSANTEAAAHRCVTGVRCDNSYLQGDRSAMRVCVCGWVRARVCVCVCVCVSVGVHSTARAADRLVEHCSTVIWFFNAPVVSSVRSTYSSLRMRTIQA